MLGVSQWPRASPRGLLILLESTLGNSNSVCFSMFMIIVFCAALSLKLDLVRFSLEADFPRCGLSVSVFYRFV